MAAASGAFSIERTKLEIDLELVEREAPQIEQARIAGAEIVEREAHANGFEAKHRQFRGVEIAQERALGELKLEPVGVEIGLGEDALDHLDEVGAAELQRRDVHRDGQVRPGPAVEAGAAQHPFAQIDDQAGVLGDRNELRRRDLADCRMVPARQRLDADDLFAARIHDRLIGCGEPIVLDGVEQVAFEELAVGQVGVHGRVVDAGAVAALVLGAVERHVGVAQNVGGVAGAAVDRRNADRGADDDVVAADHVGRADGGDDAAGDRLERIGIGLAMGDDGEFVAAEARHQILAAHDAAQPLGDVEDELVADVMAERVVDVLEVIEIDVEHRGSRAAGAHVVDHGFEPLAEIDAVGQAAYRIVQSEMAQLRFTGPDLLGGAPHVAQPKADQQREAGERHRDERQHAAGDGAARPRRLPGKAGDRTAMRIGKFDGVVAGRRRPIVDLAQMGQLQAPADFLEQCAVDITDGEYDRRLRIAGGKIGLGADSDRADESGPVEETLDQRRAAAGFCRILPGDDRNGVVRHGIKTATQQIEARFDLRAEVAGDGVAGRAEQRIFDPIAAIDDHHHVLVVETLQPFADAAIRPLRIEAVTKLGCRLRCRRRAFDLVEHMRALAGDGFLQQELFAVERDLVGALCRGQHGDDDADDGDGDDGADRHDQTEPRLVPARPLAFPGDMRVRRRQHASTLKVMKRRLDPRQ